MANKPGFMMYLDWQDSLLSLPAAELKLLLEAMFFYTSTGQEPELHKRTVKLLWATYRPRLDHDSERYQKTVEQRRAAANKRWDSERQRAAAAQPRQESFVPRSTPRTSFDRMNDYLDW